MLVAVLLRYDNGDTKVHFARWDVVVDEVVGEFDVWNATVVEHVDYLAAFLIGVDKTTVTSYLPPSPKQRPVCRRLGREVTNENAHHG